MADVDLYGRRRPMQLIREGAAKYPTFQQTQYGTTQPVAPSGGALGAIHTVLAGLGLTPGAGIPFDILDAGIYSVEALFAKDAESRSQALVGAGMSATAAIPFIGWGSRATQAGKVLKESSETVIKLTDDANRIAREALEAEAKGGSQKVLKQYNKEFKDLVENKIPKAQKEFTENLDAVDSAIKGAGGVKRTTSKAVREAQGATSGMSTKQALKYQDEMSSLINDIKKEVPKDIKKFKSNVRGPAVEGVTDAGKKLEGAKSDFGVAKYRAEDTAQAVDDFVGAGGTTNIVPFRDPNRLTGQMITQGPRKTVSRGDVPMNLSPEARTALNRRRGTPSEQLIPRGSRRQGNEVIPAGARRQGNEVIPAGARRVEGRVVEPSPYGQRLMRGAKVTGALAGAGVTAKAIKDMTSAGSGAAMQFEMGKGGLQVPQDTPEGHQKMMRSAATIPDSTITTQPVGQTRMMDYQNQKTPPVAKVNDDDVTRLEQEMGRDKLNERETVPEYAQTLYGITEEGSKDQRGSFRRGEGEMVTDLGRREAARRRQELALAARRAKGTGKPRGAGLAFLRTPDEVLNRIEEGQKSIQDSTVPREQALSRARKRMEMTKASQRGREQFYRDVAEGPRVGRPNPYMVKSPPDSRGFETEADAERIRTIDGGKYASILEEDKKKRRTRTNLLRRRR